MPDHPIPDLRITEDPPPTSENHVLKIIEEERQARIPGLRFTRQRLETLSNEISPESRHYMEIRVVIGKIDELIDEFEEIKPSEERFKI